MVSFSLLLVASRNGEGQVSALLYSSWEGGVGMTY